MPLTMKVDRQPEKPSTMPASKTTRRRRAHSRRYRLHCPALSPGRRYDLPEASVRASAPRQGRPRSESAARARPRSRPPRRRQDWRWRSAESCQQKSSGRRACPWHSPIPEQTRRTRRNRSADPPRLARVQSPAAIDRRYHCSEGGQRHQVGHQTERQKRRRLAGRAKAKPSQTDCGEQHGSLCRRRHSPVQLLNPHSRSSEWKNGRVAARRFPVFSRLRDRSRNFPPVGKAEIPGSPRPFPALPGPGISDVSH